MAIFTAIMLFATVLVSQEPDAGKNFQSLLKDSSDGSKLVRLVSLLELGKRIPSLTDEQDKKLAAEVFIERLVERDAVLIAAVKFRLGQNAEVVNKFVGPYIKSDDFRKFAMGCEAIKVIGPEAKIWTDDLTKHLESEDRGLRLGSLHSLAALDGADTLPHLDTIMKSLDSSDFNIQLSACRVISKMGPKAKKAVPQLLHLLEKGNVSTRSWASIALGGIGPGDEVDVVDLLEQRLDQFYLFDRQRALEGLALLGEKAKSTLPKVEQLMGNAEKNVQHTAARTHWKITGETDAALDTLSQLITHRIHGGDAMEIIGEMGPAGSKAVPAIIEQLKFPEAPTREAACYALASIGPAAVAAVKPLKEIMASDKDLLVRAVAEMAIEAIQPKPAAK